jgi:hypothetical protein
MELARDAIAREPFVSAAPDREPAPSLALVRPRRTRRNRTVAILKIPRLWATQFGRAATTATASAAFELAPAAADGLDAFGSEAAPKEAVPKEPVARVSERKSKVEDRSARERAKPGTAAIRGVDPATVAKWLAVILLSAGVAVAGVIGYQKRFLRAAPTGTVTVETTPAGLDVVLAGKSIGKTPLTTALAPGAYEIEVGTAPETRTLKVSVTAGMSVLQHVEFASAGAAPGTAPGGLRVQTEPPHLPVSVDGVARGQAPVAIEEMQPGEHEVTVKTSSGVVHRTVTVQSRETLSLIVSSTAPPVDRGVVAAGWISVASPVSLQLREEGKVIGTTDSDRLMLPVGDHDIELSNPTLGFTAKRTLKVTAGKTTATKIDLPNGTLSVNAQPWAEVWVDGERVGDTPIGNLARRIGSHEVIFRHPELGERRETVVIAVGKPARVGVDLRKK